MNTDPRILYIGKRIKELRTVRGLTQKELADKCDNQLSRASITSYEIGAHKNPTLTNLYAIADALEIPITELFMENEHKFPAYDKNSIAHAYRE